MFSLLFASILQVNQLTAFNDCTEIQLILEENVELGYISKKEANMILKGCRKFQERSAG